MLKGLIIFGAGLVLAVSAGLTSLGAVAKSAAPDVAVSLWPLNGFAAESIASRLLKAAVAKNEGAFPEKVDPLVLEWARRAFIAEPATPLAVATLALNAPDKNGRLLMEKAFALSRREPIVTGWMIADSSERNDTQGVLNYYDTTLRTNSSAAPVLIPVMVQALSNSESIEPFANLLMNDPPWAAQFWERLAASPEAILNGAILRERLYRKNENTKQYRDFNLLRSLVYSQNFAVAEKLYALLKNRTAEAALIKNYSFDHEPEFPPLDWELFSTGEYGAAIVDGSLRIQNAGGTFAKQIVRFPPSVVELKVIASQPIPDDVKLMIGVTCAEPLAKVPEPIRVGITKQTTIQKISNQVTPCRYYWLDLTGRASENGDGFDVSIDLISIRAEQS